MGGGFVGFSYFFGNGLPDAKLSQWLLKFVFAATASTLVSGSLAERCNFAAYIVYSTVITGLVYPVSAHWCWHPEGWLYSFGFHDHAGSGVVHLCGGTYRKPYHMMLTGQDVHVEVHDVVLFIPQPPSPSWAAFSWGPASEGSTRVGSR